jgi:hypothetical protein
MLKENSKKNISFCSVDIDAPFADSLRCEEFALDTGRQHARRLIFTCRDLVISFVLHLPTGGVGL